MLRGARQVGRTDEGQDGQHMGGQFLGPRDAVVQDEAGEDRVVEQAEEQPRQPDHHRVEKAREPEVDERDKGGEAGHGGAAPWVRCYSMPSASRVAAIMSAPMTSTKVGLS